jgi:hypothetical protein
VDAGDGGGGPLEDDVLRLLDVDASLLELAEDGRRKPLADSEVNANTLARVCARRCGIPRSMCPQQIGGIATRSEVGRTDAPEIAVAALQNVDDAPAN